MTFDPEKLNDDDIYSLAKYFSFYADQSWAQQITSPVIGKVDISEHLLFYYINLISFKPSANDDETFQKAMINGINLNRKRFCTFFLPIDKGGASMQFTMSLLNKARVEKMARQGFTIEKCRLTLHSRLSRLIAVLF